MSAGVSDRVLLTGATGLVGVWVVRHWPTTAPALVPIGSADADLLRPGTAARLLEREAPTDVIHLAWSASADPGYRHSDANDRWVDATLELAAAAAAGGARLWLTGTVVDDFERAVDDGVDAYARSKARLRRIVSADIDAEEIGWLRPYYVVDETRRRPALVDESLRSAQRGEPVALHSPGAVHDFVHASDVGAAVVCAVTSGLKGYLPIGSGRLRRVCDLVIALGARWEVAAVPSPMTAHDETAADTRWLTDHGWTPTRTQELFGDG
jgi:nucleoside-diphosphate-sugar epimerase